MGSHGDSVLESVGPLRCSRTARRLASLVGRRRTRFCGQIRSRKGAKGALRISWPRSTVARRADIQADDRQVRVGSFASVWLCPSHFRFTPDSRPSSEGSARQKSANNGSRVFSSCQKKPPEGGSSNLMIADRANAGFDLRRSGTEATCSGKYQVSPTLICGA